MIVCICFQVTEKQIKDCLPCSISDIIYKTGCGLGCGSCLEALRKLIEDQSECGGMVYTRNLKFRALGHTGPIPVTRTI